MWSRLEGTEQFDYEFSKKLLMFLESKSTVNDNLCLLWSGARNRDGYIIIRFNDRGWIGHRLVACVFNILPSYSSELNTLHKCFIRNCWNPSHLYAGNQYQNGQDQRLNKKFCRHGHPYDTYGYYTGEKNSRGNPVRRCHLCRRLTGGGARKVIDSALED